MTRKYAVIEADLGITVDVQAQTRKNFDRPEADLRVWDAISVVPQDAPIRNGVPVMPLLWFRAVPVLSSTGEHVVGSRPNPDDIVATSDARWLPLDQTWDAITSTWRPHTGPDTYQWESTLLDSPLLEDYTYRLGREIITVPAMRFEDGRYLRSSFGQFGNTFDATAWTMSMALVLEQPEANPYPLLDWYDTTGSPPQGRTKITIGEVISYSWADAISAVDPIVPIAKMRPLFLTVVVNPPKVSLTISTGPGYAFSTTASASTPANNTPMLFGLNKSIDTDLGIGAFRLLELNLWGRALTTTEVQIGNAVYASTFGASSEWA